MKWIKSRKQYLNEAKIRDVIFPRQAKEISRIWGEKFLDYEEVTPTSKIKQGKWKLSEEDKLKVLGRFMECDMKRVFDVFTSINDKFATIITDSVNTDLYTREDFKVIMTDFNIKNPTIDQIVIMYDPVFRKISLSETQASEIIQKDENGRPMRDSEGNMIKIQKEPGQVVYSNNLVNINTFVDDFNRCFRDDAITANFGSSDISNLRSYAKIDENREYKVDFEIFNKDLYLSITHNPKDILNMSISKFYASCQHLYGGGYREQVLANVFDPNSIPAFLTFETPIFWGDEKISDQLPLSRMVIRNIETFDDSDQTRIFFDRAYPDRMREVFSEIIEKYSDNKSNVSDRDSATYYFTPDIDPDDKVRDPYMDKLRIERKPYIGKNTRTLYLSRLHDWSKCKIAPDAKIKELVIETTDIPEDFSKISLSPDWVKFKYLKINTLNNFNKVKTDSISFDKCKFNSNLFNEINSINGDISKIQIISCDLSGDVDFSQFKKLDELHLIYTLDSVDELLAMVNNISVKKLVISGDLITGKEAKEKIQEIRKSGIKLEIVGPVI